LNKEDFTRTSELYLLYRKAPLDHKVITYFEMRGAQKTGYILRTALSEGVLKLGTIIKDKAGGIKPVEITKPCEGFVLLSTTTENIDWELNTRVILVEITHDQELARQTYLQKAGGENIPEKELKILQVADSLLKPYEVYIPYARKIAEKFPTSEERYMRDFDKLKTLISASALFFQYQREKDKEGRIIAAEDDYLLVYLLKDLISQSISPISNQLERFLKTAQTLSIDDKLVTREELSKELKISDRTLQRYVKEAIENELIEVMGRGSKQKIKVINIPKTISPIPEPGVIFGNADGEERQNFKIFYS